MCREDFSSDMTNPLDDLLVAILKMKYIINWPHNPSTMADVAQYEWFHCQGLDDGEKPIKSFNVSAILRRNS